MQLFICKHRLLYLPLQVPACVKLAVRAMYDFKTVQIFCFRSLAHLSTHFEITAMLPGLEENAYVPVTCAEL